MRITSGQHLHINHVRKGEFDAVALRDFDTKVEEWYPVAVAKGSLVKGNSIGSYWAPGDEIPCRKSQCTVTVIQ